MTTDQIILFSLLFVVFALLIWGRWRYDLVAFGALVAALVVGVVPTEKAFDGFGHPATVIIALVLIVSRGLQASGAIDLIAKFFVDGTRALSAHIGIMSAVAAGLSAIMNNVGALALLMPVDIQAAEKAKRSPALTLMPLSFATILGGLVTLIGTPPNIIIASYREQALGEPFGMFAFTPVGLVAATVGILFVAFIGWRLIPSARGEKNTGKELFEMNDYIAELQVTEDSPLIGHQVKDLDEICENMDVAIVGIVRRGQRLPGQSRRVEVREGDFLVVEAAPKAIDKFVGEKKLKYAGEEKHVKGLASKDLSLLEVVVPPGALVEGRSALSLRLLQRHGITLLGVSRQGTRFRDRVRRLNIQAGDILLLLGPEERLNEIADWLGTLPLAERGLEITDRRMAGAAVAIFGGAIALASFGVLYLTVALALACCLMVLLGIVPVRQIYESVEWPVIVLLGSLIPIGAALEDVGGAALIATNIVQYAEPYTAIYGPVVVLTILMIVTMTLSDVLNNTATTLIAAPIAIDIAKKLEVNPDPFLMAVAIAASCAFLTPIGHKNNTLIMGPGGYKFGDYWRMGLPLEIIIIAVSVPMILLVWPF